MSRTSTIDSFSLPGTPRRRSSSNLLTPPLQALDNEASQLIRNALERTSSEQQQQTLKAPEVASRTSTSGSFSKMSFSSMMGGLSSLSLSRTSTRDSTTPSQDDKEARGRSMSSSSKDNRVKSASQNPVRDTDPSRSRSRARSQSPFSFRRLRHRESSPTPQAIPLAHSDIDLSDSASASSMRPRSTAFSDDHDSGDDTVGETEDEDDDWSDDDFFDPVTERNTERNAIIVPVEGGIHGLDGEVEADPDPLGEGVNVVVPPEPYFPSTLNSGGTLRGKRNPRRKKSMKHHEPLPFRNSRPVFQRDRCTITITQGDPEATLGERRKRRYVVASDLSEESRYAVEWGIGTVLRDGDEMLIVTIVENEAKGAFTTSSVTAWELTFSQWTPRYQMRLTVPSS